MAELTDRTTSDDGTEIVFHLFGSGEPLVFVHGGANTGRDYLQVARLLADSFRIALMERRNYGVSGLTGSPHTFEQEAPDVAAVIAALGGQASVFGHSAGALVSLHAARRYPDLVSMLALYEPPLSASGPTIEPVMAKQRRLAAEGQLVEALVVGYVHLLGMDDEVARQRLKLKSSGLEDLVQQTLNDVEAWARLDPDPTAWSGLAMPTLLVRGTASVEHPLRDSITQLEAAISQAITVEMPGQDHIAHLIAPGMLARVLRDFLLDGTG